MSRIKKSDLSGANHPPGRGEDGEEEDVVGEGDEAGRISRAESLFNRNITLTSQSI